MNELIWHKGAPPHVGWWNASAFRNPLNWRWWDGTQWSLVVSENEAIEVVAIYAIVKCPWTFIEWTDFYPKNARVPRVDPIGEK